ncbi:MAG: SDR family NAD(P)-dependent oxidoreductase [Gammaproteobacteria bacterium]|nr:SDR family NAD(P)-dependent oxidoreductase [Gammaproteobacteria bacterium]
MRFKNLPEAFDALVVGASRGIGAEFVRQLLDDESCRQVVACGRSVADSEALPDSERLIRQPLDVTGEESWQQLVARLDEHGIKPRLLIYTVGILHSEGGIEPEKRAADLAMESLQQAFGSNVFGAMLMARYLLPLLSRQESAVLAHLSARVGSIGDNRLGGWYAYRASKAALNQHMKTLAVELSRSHKQACVVNLHPGTTDTGLSKPFQGGVPEDKLFSTAFAAGKLLEILRGVGPADSGRFIAWDGQDIPW